MERPYPKLCYCRTISTTPPCYAPLIVMAFQQKSGKGGGAKFSEYCRSVNAIVKYACQWGTGRGG